MASVLRFRAGTAFLLALVMLGAYVAPVSAAAGLRAARCCAERCAKPRSATAASHCCAVVASSVDVGAFSAPRLPQDSPGLALLAVATAAEPSGGLIPSRFALPDSPASRAAPIFLRTLSLRL